ncbi:YciI family protein [Dictyobacter alpinus]
MRYLVLIYGNEAELANRSPEEKQAEMTAYNDFTSMIQKRGVQLGGEALHPTSSATTVRVRQGKVLTTDGPFAETKEQLGGFYIIQSENLDEAIEIAAKVPNATDGSIEIRPIVEWN